MPTYNHFQFHGILSDFLIIFNLSAILLLIVKIIILTTYKYLNGRYRLTTHIEDDTGETMVTIFGKAAQILIKKPCSTLTIDEGFTDPLVIPPIIEQLKGQTKIFQIYFKTRGTTMTTIVSKVFDEQPLEVPALLPPIIKSLDPKTPTPTQITAR